MNATPRSAHDYAARVSWTGNLGEGTSAYAAYARAYRVSIDGKPDLEGSADPLFRGDAAKHNPEDLFVASLSACHMLVYLALCAREGVRVTAYEDDARGTLALGPGAGGRFTEVVLRPAVTVAGAEALDRAERLHHDAHEACFIARSCSVPVHVRPTVRAG